MLSIRGLNQYYGASHTLRDIQLDIQSGRVFCLMGRNGVGKTTLLNTVLGLLPAQSGDIEFKGAAIDRLATEDRVAQGIGYVPQGRMIFPDLSVMENLRVALAGRRGGDSKIPQQIFDFFPVLAEMADRRGGDLSGGQQQQLAIGRALVLEPSILLLDEPCEGIQPNIVQLIAEVIQRLRSEQGLSVLLVEQKLPFARSVADDFAIMDRGAVVATGAMDELSESLVGEYLTV
ncbi:urea ABC transporter ATP-binding subunit UrtE [Congregibacter variabilis]|uniref:Urea ABC transporter ATP-binding subunit UrtE n=1 Tax=Congregibacter variabilis TaxID=3081200 RepID=A0ABZ0I7M2_9GAMM|nr:urea ABC transporter ATP-binding subunit UrtE [Congregibacter sp. IMCC43200]